MRDNYRDPRRLLLSWLAAHICVSVVGQLCLMVSRGQAQIPINGLVAKYDLNGDAHNSVPGTAPNGHVVGALPAPDRFGNANSSFAFNGISNYIEIPDSDVFSVSSTGELSISVWVRPDGTSLDNNGRLLFSKKESTGYVHWMGKGVPDQHEWAFRIYSADNTDDPYRANRMSFYLFKPEGGRGPGSYVEEPIVPGQWIHYVAIVRSADETITWFKNGVQRDQDSFGVSAGEFHVVPVNGSATVRIGTRDGESYFAGAVDDIRIYNRAVTLQEIQQLRLEEPFRLPGDFNRDGSVDARDYVVWRKGLGISFTQDQYNEWRANFGRTAIGSIDSARSGAARYHFAPEPSAAVIIIGGGMSCFSQRHRATRFRRCFYLTPGCKQFRTGNVR